VTSTAKSITKLAGMTLCTNSHLVSAMAPHLLPWRHCRSIPSHWQGYRPCLLRFLTQYYHTDWLLALQWLVQIYLFSPRPYACPVFLWFPFAYLISLLSTFHMFTFFLTHSHLHLKSHFHFLLALTGTPVKNMYFQFIGLCLASAFTGALPTKQCFSLISTDFNVRKLIRWG